MSGVNLKSIVTKEANTWKKEGDTFPEIIRAEDGTIVRAEYVELPNGELMIMEYDIDPDDPDMMKKVRAFQNAETSGHRDESEPMEKSEQKQKDFDDHEPVEKKTFNRTKPVVAFVVVLAVILSAAGYGISRKIKQTDKKGNDMTATSTDVVTEEEFIGENALSTFTADNYWFETNTDAAVKAVIEPDIHPHCVESTNPENLIVSTSISVNDEIWPEDKPFQMEDEITFCAGKDYASLPGVITFRGNNYRSDPTYGYAELTENDLETIWSKQTGALTSGSNTWSGSGWTGQPLICKWPSEVKQHMNMYDWAKEKDDLVEVIYACMDGNVYFLDLTTGEPTRDTMSIGYTFKGAGALDPRGYPIMYLGAGINSNQGAARVFVINLLDCSVMYTFGNGDSFAPRGGVSFFDSSALVDAETDTLIYPGENGVLYFVKLGTNYDEKAGTLSINPSTIKWTYHTKRNGAAYWYGMEDSAVIYKGYLYIMDNGGDFMCLDLKTLELVWVQDSLDDSNGSPVLEVEGDKVYLYASTSFHLGWRSSSTAPIPIWKIDAETGEIVWQTEYECQSIEDLSGGVQSTIAVGREGLADYIYVTVSRTGGMNNGVLACISKKTGDVIWEHEAAYAWSSPACVYNSDGSGRVIYCSSNGKMYLLDGLTGEQLDAEVLSEGVIEASPAVYYNCAVVGTRNCSIKCVWLK